MNILKYINEVRRRGRRWFTLEELQKAKMVSKNAALNAIFRLKSRGELISPAKGLYVIVPPEHQNQGSIPPHELIPILMNYLNTDYYVSLLSAAEFHGSSHQKPSRYQIVSNKRIKHPLEFGKVKIELIYKKSLAGLPTQNFTVSSGYLKVATPELLALDLLSYPIRCGGLNHIATVLSELIDAMDADRLAALVKISGKMAWVQRMGFILEQIDPMDPSKKGNLIATLQQSLAMRKFGYIPLAPELPRSGAPRSKKWGIIANTDIESDV